MHNNSAFGLGLVLDAGGAAGLPAPVLDAATDRLKAWFEADAMRRVLHLTLGLPTVSSGDFSSDHWLATYAALALDTAPGH